MWASSPSKVELSFFCMEGLDRKVRTTQVNLSGYAAHPTGETTARYDPALLDGVVVLEHTGMLPAAAEGEAL